jgi:hypothetical protein
MFVYGCHTVAKKLHVSWVKKEGPCCGSKNTAARPKLFPVKLLLSALDFCGSPAQNLYAAAAAV